MTLEKAFTGPPPKDVRHLSKTPIHCRFFSPSNIRSQVLLELARGKNIAPLPFIKSHCGLRLPPDRHCLVAANYKLRAAEVQPKKLTKTALDRAKSGKNAGGTAMKRQSIATIPKTQTVTIPKPVFKFSGNSGKSGAATTPTAANTSMTSKSQSQSGQPTPQDIKMEVDDDYMSSAGGSMKRKHDDDDFEVVG